MNYHRSFLLLIFSSLSASSFFSKWLSYPFGSPRLPQLFHQDSFDYGLSIRTAYDSVAVVVTRLTSGLVSYNGDGTYPTFTLDAREGVEPTFEQESIVEQKALEVPFEQEENIDVIKLEDGCEDAIFSDSQAKKINRAFELYGLIEENKKRRLEALDLQLDFYSPEMRILHQEYNKLRAELNDLTQVHADLIKLDPSTQEEQVDDFANSWTITSEDANIKVEIQEEEPAVLEVEISKAISKEVANIDRLELINSLKAIWSNFGIPYESEMTPHLVQKLSIRGYFDRGLPLRPSEKEFVSDSIFPNIEGMYKIQGDGDCAFRSFLTGFFLTLKQGSLSEGRIESIALNIMKANPEALNIEYLTSEQAAVLSHAQNLLSCLISNSNFFPMSSYMDIMNDLDLSRALIYFLRHLVSRECENSATCDPIVRFMGVTSSTDVFHELAKTFETNIQLYQLAGSSSTIVPFKGSGLLENSDQISIMFFNGHFDLLVKSWTLEDQTLFEAQEKAEWEAIMAGLV